MMHKASGGTKRWEGKPSREGGDSAVFRGLVEKPLSAGDAAEGRLKERPCSPGRALQAAGDGQGCRRPELGNGLLPHESLPRILPLAGSTLREEGSSV